MKLGKLLFLIIPCILLVGCSAGKSKDVQAEEHEQLIRQAEIAKESEQLKIDNCNEIIKEATDTNLTSDRN